MTWRTCWAAGSDRSRVLSRSWTVLVCLGLCLLVVSPAQAHTELESSTPADGARLSRPPTAIRLSFSEPVSTEFAQLSLRTAGDAPHALRPIVEGRVVRGAVPRSGTTRGAARTAWTVTYRVVSADGHPITGSLRFTAPKPGTRSGERGGNGASEAPANSADPAATESDYGMGTWLIGLGALVLVATSLLALLAFGRRESPE